MHLFRTGLIAFIVICPVCCLGQYFQQEVNHTIHVYLDDRKNVLSAIDSIVYKNNSPDTLKEIYFHLYPSAYKNTSTPLAAEFFNTGDNRMLKAPPDAFGRIDSLDFRIDGKAVKWRNLNDTIDVCRVVLNLPLLPGDSILITTPFLVKIPDATLSRLGHDNQSYYISQWYPKPAVYNGRWNYFSYRHQGEFFSDFGSYDVYINLPDSYLLAATGRMTNAPAEEIRLKESDSLVRAGNYKSESVPTSSTLFKRLHFRQDNIHDFAWFAGKNFNVLQEEVIISEKKSVLLRAFFHTNQREHWINGFEVMKDALLKYSGWIGEYPYRTLTFVDVAYASGGDMEYPTIATINKAENQDRFNESVVHELAHNWFYGALGTNERCHPWMDEGITSYYESRYLRQRLLSDTTENNGRNESSYSGLFSRLLKDYEKDNVYLNYLFNARRNTDQSPDLCSEKIRQGNYGPGVYYKPLLSFNFLQSYLGEDMFDRCMRAYYNEWKFRHPAPADMKIIFERECGKKLDWLFDDLLGNHKKLDYKLCGIDQKSAQVIIAEIKNAGDVPGPVCLVVIKEDKTIYRRWKDGFINTDTIHLPSTEYDRVVIYPDRDLPELNFRNNTMRYGGICRKTEKIRLSFGTAIENPELTQIFYSPVIGANVYNGFMVGAVIHNITPHEKAFEYAFMPMYAFRTNDASGGLNLSYHIYPKSSINKITVRSGLSHYAFAEDTYESRDFIPEIRLLIFSRLENKITFSLLNRVSPKKVTNEVFFRNLIIRRDIPYFINYKRERKDFIYWHAGYQRENANPLQKSKQTINLFYSDDYKAASVEAKNFFTYGSKKKGFSTRFYAGYTKLATGGTYGIDYHMSLSGREGYRDFLFDEVFPGRTETIGIFSKQFVTDYAGFRTPVSFFREAQDWMTGINLNTTLPKFLPFRIFANVGFFDGSDLGGRFNNVSWELGIDLPIIKDIFVVYFPFIYSEDIKYAVQQQNFSKGDLIRFELHLTKLNPLHLIKSIGDN